MKTVLAAIALLCAVVVSPLVGQGDGPDSRHTLAGLRGVYVAVGDVDEDAEQKGLSKARLQTDVELKLRQAGIRVLTEEEVGRTPGLPYLYVTVNTLHPREPSLSGVYAFAVSVELVQTICLHRSPSMLTIGRTLNATGAFGTVGADNLGEYVRKRVSDGTDEFINAYLAANPKR